MLNLCGAIYHGLSRGDHRDDSVRGDEDRELFLKMLSEPCANSGWHVHEICYLLIGFKV